VQAIAWKPHNWTSLCSGFFAINDNLPVDLEKPQTLRCIICRTKQVNALEFCQRSILEKGLIKYGKIIGIVPMRTLVEFAHPKLVDCKKVGHYWIFFCYY
jgi:hypothetical protein